MTHREKEIIELIHSEVKPALGCTEPIAVALAAAKACEVLRERVSKVGDEGTSEHQEPVSVNLEVEVSGNILKNGMGVGIPGTGMVGLHIAAALGAVCGKSQYGLEVLHDLCPEAVEKAKRLVSEGKVKVVTAKTSHKLYVKVLVTTSGEKGVHSGSAVIEDDHDRIVETWFDSRLLSNTRSSREDCESPASTEVLTSNKEELSPLDNDLRTSPAEEEVPLGRSISIREIYDFARTVSFEDIAFILESKTMNLRLAEEGLAGDYGLRVGKTLSDPRFTPVFGKDFLSYAMSLTAAASDARMAGCTLPAMSNSGSGNQGITVTMPVIAYALHSSISDEALARALVLSHLTAIHIKSYLGKLSALCGCVIASTGASCGLVYLRGGGYREMCNAIKNMIGNITGMVCDGAKTGCAMKVASGVACAVQSAVLALDGVCISSCEGIIEDDIEKTIRNLGRIGSVGMQTTDDVILEIMSNKD